jgi:hypothetical protein
MRWRRRGNKKALRSLDLLDITDLILSEGAQLSSWHAIFPTCADSASVD